MLLSRKAARSKEEKGPHQFRDVKYHPMDGQSRSRMNTATSCLGVGQYRDHRSQLELTTEVQTMVMRRHRQASQRRLTQHHLEQQKTEEGYFENTEQRSLRKDRQRDHRRTHECLERMTVVQKLSMRKDKSGMHPSQRMIRELQYQESVDSKLK